MGGAGGSRREALRAAYRAIGNYERQLAAHLLEGVSGLDQIKVYGITDPARMNERVPTFSINHRRLPASRLADQLGRAGIFSWHGHYYALLLTEALGFEPEGMVRIGLLHYNTKEEIDRLLQALHECGGG